MGGDLWHGTLDEPRVHSRLDVHGVSDAHAGELCSTVMLNILKQNYKYIDRLKLNENSSASRRQSTPANYNLSGTIA